MEITGFPFTIDNNGMGNHSKIWLWPILMSVKYFSQQKSAPNNPQKNHRTGKPHKWRFLIRTLLNFWFSFQLHLGGLAYLSSTSELKGCGRTRKTSCKCDPPQTFQWFERLVWKNTCYLRDFEDSLGSLAPWRPTASIAFPMGSTKAKGRSVKLLASHPNLVMTGGMASLKNCWIFH